MVLQVGIVGTGYVATKRAEIIQNDPRAEVVAVTGNSPEKTQALAERFGLKSIDSWQQLVNLPELDLIIISTITRDHGIIAQAAIESGKHVVVENPLALDTQQARAIIDLASSKGKMLHIEHIELLGGVHRAAVEHLPKIGKVFYARYVTIVPQATAPRRWTFHQEMFGFPFMGALSRIHRFVDLFGMANSISCQSRFWDAPELGYYTACLCTLQLRFPNDMIAHLSYGKGEVFSKAERTLEFLGDKGILLFEGEVGKLIQNGQETPIAAETRQGLFLADTTRVLDHLTEGKPLYVDTEASYTSLRIGEAAYKSAKSGLTLQI